jgi:hypothetical protein
MNIDDMQAGTEMDKLIHERVIGRCWHEHGNSTQENPNGDYYCKKCGVEIGCNDPVNPAYSTDIDAVWKVVEKLKLIVGPAFGVSDMSWIATDQWNVRDAKIQEDGPWVLIGLGVIAVSMIGIWYLLCP